MLVGELSTLASSVGPLGRVQVFLDILDRVPGQILVDLDDHA
jgi:hypothetical protein